MTDRNPLIQLMMVDDNEDDQILFRNAFSRSVHFRIGELAVDGEQALEKLGRVSNRVGSSPPALVLLDINLPKRDGFQILSELKKDPFLRSIPVVILSTSSRQEDVRRALELGAASYLCKPSTQEGLRDLVESFDRYWGETSILPTRGV